MVELFIILQLCVFILAKHPVPTYFKRVDGNGNLIDRLSPSYSEVTERKPRVNLISREDAASIKFHVWPAIVKNGGNVSIVWSGIVHPDPEDYIAYYCPYYDDPSHYIDYILVSEVQGWYRGHGNYNVTVHNMREACVFKYYRNTNTSYRLAAISNLINFAGGSNDPLQGHIAMTNEPTEMRIMWTSGKLTQSPVVRYGTTKDLPMKENTHVTRTYGRHSMCQFPANSIGFWDPGYMYDILITNLQPNTLYYYSYGTDISMSPLANFTTPLPKGDPSPYKFIVYGDMGVSVWPGKATTTAKNVLKEIRDNDVKFVLHHGDISYARGFAYQWEEWFAITEPYATLIPYMVGIGNHEYDHSSGGIGHDPSNVSTDDGWRPSWFNGYMDSGGECGVPMFYRYQMPDNGNSLFWYSYNFGMVHMIMMSTEHDFSPSSQQYQWLEKDLMNVDRKVTPWLIIAGHRPMYCSQIDHGDHVVATHMQDLLEDLIYKYKVDIAFWAHYHLYERTCKLFKKKCVDDGIVHIVVGSAGFILTPGLWFDREWSIFRESAYGYGRVTVANSSALLYEWVKNKDRKVKDYVWLYK